MGFGGAGVDRFSGGGTWSLVVVLTIGEAAEPPGPGLLLLLDDDDVKDFSLIPQSSLFAFDMWAVISCLKLLSGALSASALPVSCA